MLMNNDNFNKYLSTKRHLIWTLGVITDTNIKLMFIYYTIYIYSICNKNIEDNTQNSFVSSLGSYRWYRYHLCRSMAAANSGKSSGPRCCTPRLVHATSQESVACIYYCFTVENK